MMMKHKVSELNGSYAFISLVKVKRAVLSPCHCVQ